MKTNSTDILLRPNSYDQPSLWLSQEFLLSNLPGLSKTYLEVKARPTYKKSVQPCFHKKDFLPDTQKAWRWGRFNGRFYYAYDNIPDKAPNFYASALPSRKELIVLKQSSIKDEQRNPAETILEPVLSNYQHHLQYYSDCTRQQQHNLAIAAALLEAAIEYVREDGNSNEAIKSVADFAERFHVKYWPHHYSNVRKMILRGINGESIHDIIHLPRAGNKNAVVHCEDDEIKSWILIMRQSGKNFTNAHIIRKLQWMCSACDKPMPSERWIGTEMEQANIRFLAASGRFGEKGRYGQPSRGYTPFANALYAGDCWQVDGSRFNIIDFKMQVEQDGKIVSKNVFLYVVAVRDVHSGDILGYSFNLAENRWTYIQALKMAVEEAGYLPYEIVFDRFPGHNTPEAVEFFADLQNRGVKVTFTHKAEGKARVERWFRTLQEVFMQGSDYYYGEGIQSRNRYAHRSKEYLKNIRSKAKSEGWNFDQACEEAGNIIEAYRSTKLSHYSRKYKLIDESPATLHAASEKPHVVNLEPYQLTYLFGFRRTAKIANMGLIDFQLQGVTLNYRCDNYDVVSRYDSVLIAYDLDNMDQIHLYEISDRPVKRYLGTATEIADIIPYGPEAFKGYGKQQAIIRQLEEFRAQELEYKMAVGYDSVAILDGTNRSKYEYEKAEAAATFNHVIGENSSLDGYDMSNQL